MPRMTANAPVQEGPGALARQALAHSARGDHAGALRAAVHALALEDGPVTRDAFVECLRWMRFDADNDVLRQLLLRVLREGWARPEDVAPQCCDLIRAAGTGLDALASDTLLMALMVRAINLDPVLEQALSAARQVLLMRAPAGEETPLEFHAALAQQCFLNEYVFADDAAQAVSALRDRIAAALDRGAQPTGSDVTALASYEALTDTRLLDHAWPPSIDALLTQQLREVAQEHALAEAMRCLTPLSDPVSRAVAAQYEANPYPRWVVAGPARPAPSGAHIRNILIAGCGTGRNAIETARSFADAQVMAIDLSRASLAHAAHKTRGMGVTNITYAQADLLALGGLETRFDLIEAMGVLHHLADPFAGWRALLALLAPSGVMRVGLYSPVARRHITAARAELAAQGFASTVEGIRAARQYLMARPEYAEVVQRPDFFSISACRDLLFHVQETCLPLTAIAAFLRQEKLRVLGLDVEAPVLAAYAARFPNDPDATDLDNWAAFEADNPDTFDGMVQFWVTRA